MKANSLLRLRIGVRLCIGVGLWLTVQSSHALFPDESLLTLEGQPMQTTELEIKAGGFMRNTGSDSYFTFRDLNVRRELACAIKMDLEFAEPMYRPGLFEVFWHNTEGGGFRESLKAFFIVNQEDSKSRKEFIIPLCKLFHYSGNMNNPTLQSMLGGLRIDYPSNKDISIKLHSIELLDAQQMMDLLSNTPDNLVILEPYERLHPGPATSLDVMVPKLLFIFEEGLSRLWVDKGFLFTWLLLILALKILILRSFLRK